MDGGLRHDEKEAHPEDVQSDESCLVPEPVCDCFGTMERRGRIVLRSKFWLT